MFKVYDYECQKCDNTEEHLVDTNVEAVFTCKCGGLMRQVLSAVMGRVKNTSNPVHHSRSKH